MKPWALILLPLCFSCGQPSSAESPEADRVRREAGAMLHAYHAAIAERGLTAEFDYLDDSPDFFWVPPGFSSALSYDSVRAILESNAGLFSRVEFRWDTLRVSPLSADIATFSGIVSGRMLDTLGVESHTTLLESGTLIRRDGGWKLLSGQSRVLGE